MKQKFSQVVAGVSLVLIVLSIISTFVGALINSAFGDGLMWAGIFGFVFFAIMGWIMIRVYERVHKDEEITDKLIAEAGTAPVEEIPDQNEPENK